jgi:hypothetical protein
VRQKSAGRVDSCVSVSASTCVKEISYYECYLERNGRLQRFVFAGNINRSFSPSNSKALKSEYIIYITSYIFTLLFVFKMPVIFRNIPIPPFTFHYQHFIFISYTYIYKANIYI